MTAVQWPWQREHVPSFEERDQTYREQHADRVIKRMEALTDDLERVVEELHSIARRFGGAEE